ncbi:MAG: DegT/DnrJ/EryC1/StrS family aminotransferase [Deltaproteobacteria bacterium]|nr:DegT/DnrJ/EryC1/StrS family aminotransferase [Deltaproteobacteria bacterium]
MPGYEVMGEEEKKEILEVLETGVLFRYGFPAQRKGRYKVEEFEKKFAEFTGRKHALAVSSGSAALKVALAALGVGFGDEVITSGFTFVATWEAILECGAVPVFAGIDDTLNLDPKELPKKITPRTKAIIPVHMLGAQARIEEIMAVAEQYHIPVIEDTAQASGGFINGKYLGSFGAIGTFSFDSVKTMTTGEGGMLIMDDPELYRRASEYHDHGHDHIGPDRGLESRSFIGFNFRMMELQGALGLAQLSKLKEMIARQKTHKNHLKKILSGITDLRFRELVDPEGDTATFLAFSLPDQEKTWALKDMGKKLGLGLIYFLENNWHYYRNWEHLLLQKTPSLNGWPFKVEDGIRKLAYPKNLLSRTDERMARLLVMAINIRMDETIFAKAEELVAEANKNW